MPVLSVSRPSAAICLSGSFIGRVHTVPPFAFLSGSFIGRVRTVPPSRVIFPRIIPSTSIAIRRIHSQKLENEGGRSITGARRRSRTRSITNQADRVTDWAYRARVTDRSQKRSGTTGTMRYGRYGVEYLNVSEKLWSSSSSGWRKLWKSSGWRKLLLWIKKSSFGMRNKN